MFRTLDNAELEFVSGGDADDIGWRLTPGEQKIALSIYDLNSNNPPSTNETYGPVDGDGGGYNGDGGSQNSYYADPAINNAFLQAYQEVRDQNLRLGTDELNTDAGSSINGTVVQVGNIAFFFGVDANGSAFGVRVGPDQGND